MFTLQKCLSYILRLSVCRSPVGKVALLFFQCRRIKPFAAIKSRDFIHFLCGQRKVEDVKVIPDMLRICGFREDHISRLNVPAENDLHIGLAVFLCKLGKNRLIYQPFVAVTDGIPAFDDRAVFCDTFFQFVLLVVLF